MRLLRKLWIALGGRAPRTPQTHDYRNNRRFWGHDLTWTTKDGGESLDAAGWGLGVGVGDHFLLSRPQDGSDTRYRVAKVNYVDDPPDMWFAKLAFAPRQSGSIERGGGRNG